MKNILVVGSINIDFCIHTDKLPVLGETVAGYGFGTKPGGKGANQAVGMAKLGANVKMIGAVGDDISGGTLLYTLKEHHVGCAAVQQVHGPTGTALITVCRGDNCIIIDKGANAYVTPQVLERERPLFEWADIVVLQFEIPEETIAYAVKTAKAYGATVVVNPAPAPATADASLLKQIDILIPNEYEASMLLHQEIRTEEDERRAVLAFADLGVKNVIITLGSSGAIVANARESHYCPCIDVVEVKDPTAAGDSFVGAYTTAVCAGLTPAQALEFASYAATITVSKIGAQPSLPTLDEVIALMKEQKFDSFDLSVLDVLK